MGWRNKVLVGASFVACLVLSGCGAGTGGGAGGGVAAVPLSPPEERGPGGDLVVAGRVPVDVPLDGVEWIELAGAGLECADCRFFLGDRVPAPLSPDQTDPRFIVLAVGERRVEDGVPRLRFPASEISEERRQDATPLFLLSLTASYRFVAGTVHDDAGGPMAGLLMLGFDDQGLPALDGAPVFARTDARGEFGPVPVRGSIVGGFRPPTLEIPPGPPQAVLPEVWAPVHAGAEPVTRVALRRRSGCWIGAYPVVLDLPGFDRPQRVNLIEQTPMGRRTLTLAEVRIEPLLLEYDAVRFTQDAMGVVAEGGTAAPPHLVVVTSRRDPTCTPGTFAAWVRGRVDRVDDNHLRIPKLFCPGKPARVSGSFAQKDMAPIGFNVILESMTGRRTPVTLTHLDATAFEFLKPLPDTNYGSNVLFPFHRINGRDVPVSGCNRCGVGVQFEVNFNVDAQNGARAEVFLGSDRLGVFGSGFHTVSTLPLAGRCLDSIDLRAGIVDWQNQGARISVVFASLHDDSPNVVATLGAYAGKPTIECFNAGGGKSRCDCLIPGSPLTRVQSCDTMTLKSKP